ncbi:MAG: ribonuclease Z [Candidatus Odinarchaeia archaeon]
MDLFFLGTSGGMPTVNRSGPAIALRINGRIILFDCGEGTQVQMQKLPLSISKIHTILITHLHGDHIGGLPGILMTLGLFNRKNPLLIIGPKGIKDFLKCLSETAKLGIIYPIRIKEIEKEREEIEFRDYKIIAVKAIHNEVYAYSYILVEKERPGRFYPEKALDKGVPEGELWSRLQRGETIVLDGATVTPQEVLGPKRRGRKVVYTGDSRPNPNLVELAKDADVLIHESTFNDEHQDKAFDYGHSTAAEAAEFAVKVNAKKLILFHISPRYTDTKEMLKRAKEIFKNTIIAKDLLKIRIPYPE